MFNLRVDPLIGFDLSSFADRLILKVLNLLFFLRIFLPVLLNGCNSLDYYWPCIFIAIIIWINKAWRIIVQHEVMASSWNSFNSLLIYYYYYFYLKCCFWELYYRIPWYHVEVWLFHFSWWDEINGELMFITPENFFVFFLFCYKWICLIWIIDSRN